MMTTFKVAGNDDEVVVIHSGLEGYKIPVGLIFEWERKKTKGFTYGYIYEPDRKKKLLIK